MPLVFGHRLSVFCVLCCSYAGTILVFLLLQKQLCEASQYHSKVGKYCTTAECSLDLIWAALFEHSTDSLGAIAAAFSTYKRCTLISLALHWCLVHKRIL